MKPERDPVTCAVSGCDDEARAATPYGPLCAEHSREAAE
jgi:hypothetical protein